MKIKSIQYSRVFSLGNFENEKIGAEVEVGEFDDPIEAFKEAKKFVELSSQTVTDKLEQAKKIVQNPDEYTGAAVKKAKEFLNQFEEQKMIGS